MSRRTVAARNGQSFAGSRVYLHRDTDLPDPLPQLRVADMRLPGSYLDNPTSLASYDDNIEGDPQPDPARATLSTRSRSETSSVYLDAASAAGADEDLIAEGIRGAPAKVLPPPQIALTNASVQLIRTSATPYDTGDYGNDVDAMYGAASSQLSVIGARNFTPIAPEFAPGPPNGVSDVAFFRYGSAVDFAVASTDYASAVVGESLVDSTAHFESFTSDVGSSVNSTRELAYTTGLYSAASLGNVYSRPVPFADDPPTTVDGPEYVALNGDAAGGSTRAPVVYLPPLPPVTDWTVFLPNGHNDRDLAATTAVSTANTAALMALSAAPTEDAATTLYGARASNVDAYSAFAALAPSVASQSLNALAPASLPATNTATTAAGYLARGSSLYTSSSANTAAFLDADPFLSSA